MRTGKKTGVLASTLATAIAATLSGAPAQAHGPNVTRSFDFYEIGYQVYGFDSTSPTAVPLTPTLPGKSAGDMIMITSKLVNYADRLNPLAPVVATLHGICTFTTDPHLFLTAPNPIANGATPPPSGTVPEYVMRCEQTITFVGASGSPFGVNQIQMEGAVDQVAFEAGEPSYLSVTGGTGTYVNARGQGSVTQLIFPNIKRIQLTVSGLNQ